MKRLVALVGCVVFLFSGCQGSGQSKSAVEVIIEGGGEFPQFLVGRWKDEEKGWEFVFEPDGTISSAVIDSGFIKVIPSEGVATIPMKMEGKAIYELGQWTVQYSPDSRELAVEVVVDFSHVDIGKTWLEGHSTDWFVGTISEDYQTWQADWISFPKYIAFTPEPNELPVDPNGMITQLVFRKVADKGN